MSKKSDEQYQAEAKVLIERIRTLKSVSDWENALSEAMTLLKARDELKASYVIRDNLHVAIEQLRADNAAVENSIDEQWLNAIAVQWKFYCGKQWDALDGETPEEGRQANVNAIFAELEKLKADNAALLVAANLLRHIISFDTLKEDDIHYILNGARQRIYSEITVGEMCDAVKALTALKNAGVEV